MTNFKHIRQKKILMLVALGSIGALFLLSLVSCDDRKSATAQTKKVSDPVELKIESAESHLPKDAMWRYQADQAASAQAKKHQQEIEAVNDNIKKMSEQMEQYRQEKEQQQNNPVVEALDFGDIEEENSDARTYETSTYESFVPAEMVHHRLNLKPIERPVVEAKTFRTTDTIIPATTFVKATLISGVDASTAITSSADPLPVMIKLRNDGYIPRKLKSDLKGCHVLAAAKGDLSAERVHVRLEKLVCTEIETKEIVETDVAGFVVGPDGKNGIRGEVISKDGQYLGRALAGGVLSGFANVLNPDSATSGMGNALLQNSEKKSTGDVFKTGFAGSASNSTDRLAQYYIDRAEQIQPVISIPGGVNVEIVFTQSVDIGSSNVKQHLSKQRDIKREQTVKDLWHGDRK